MRATFLRTGAPVAARSAGLLDRGDLIDGMVTLSAQSGYWRYQGGEQKLAVAFHVHITFPVVTRIVGYLPWSAFSRAEDLPKGVALQWARWCRDPRYLLGDDSLPLERLASFRAPVLAYSIEDDKWGTRQAVDAMMSAYPNCERRHVTPATYGLERLGHLGAFRTTASALWDETIDWFDALYAPRPHSHVPLRVG